jgi:hypothetical protein
MQIRIYATNFSAVATDMAVCDTLSKRCYYVPSLRTGEEDLLPLFRLAFFL